MHKLAEKIADCLKAKVEGKGIDNIEGQDLVEFELWSKVIKNLVCYDKDKKIIEAMDEAEESEEAMKYIEMYEDYPESRRGYRGQPRDSRGRYMSRGRGGRRGYEPEMMMYDEDWEEMERLRDFDRGAGKMYYNGSGSSGSSSSGMSSGGSSSGGMSSGSMGSQGGSRGYSDGGRGNSESRYDRAKRSYTETKEMHKGGSAEDKQLTMREAEKMVNVIFDELEESLSDAPKEVKDMIKNKGMAKLQKIQ